MEVAAGKEVGKEFLELAVEIEKNGRSFYEQVGRTTKDKDARRVFVELASREQEHENTFRSMLARIGGHHPDKKYVVEHTQYIRALGRTSVFTGERAEAVKSKKILTDVEAAETGIGFEKDSILFYGEVRGMVARPDQEIIDMIISEEQKHLIELTYLADKLRDSRDRADILRQKHDA